MTGAGDSPFWDFYCIASKEEHHPPVASGERHCVAGAIAKKRLWRNCFLSSISQKMLRQPILSHSHVLLLHEMYAHVE